jgi:hypothetical protein
VQSHQRRLASIGQRSLQGYAHEREEGDEVKSEGGELDDVDVGAFGKILTSWQV